MVHNSARKKAIRRQMSATGRAYLDAERTLDVDPFPAIDLGPSAQGGRIIWEPWAGGAPPHLLIEGRPGSGKSCMLSRLVKQLPTAWPVILGDPLKSGFDCEGWSGRDVLTESSEILEALSALLGAARSPYPTVVVIDEARFFVESLAKDESREVLEFLLRYGRSKRIHVVLAGQRLDRSVLPPCGLRDERARAPG
ncbi:AAA family ATPase [Brachybacterium kimchii]|uniref:ORC1/DEAH AAA+ ATPase domain-containing protein n=1 Tax=Brachybacterium kimchii TaxID=2942909 RepID=A0ABY4N7G4_9MICO|nr:AAA family ATPase [Brachybacterium kimchii]UQN30501.1 hypothetical protein M4486_03925 [Brachybacterium kimchii]